MSTSGASAPPVQSTLKFSTVSCGRTSSNIMQGPVEPKPKATSGHTTELAAGVVPMIIRDVSPGAGRIGVIFGAVCHELSPAQNSPVCVTTWRSEEHTSELQSPCNLVCRLLLEKKKRLKKFPIVD